MFKLIYPSKDATIYERQPYKNTGVDQILELLKNTEGNRATDQADSAYAWENTYNSRILIKFDITDISRSISRNEIHKNAQFFLSLNATEAISIPTNFTIYAYPLASDWENGNGSYYNRPETTNGVSWKYKTSKITGDSWTTSSYAGNTTGSWQTTAGGGTWYTGSMFTASQSIDLNIPDIRMDVSNIVRKWLSGSIPNNGFIIKYKDSDEASSKIFGSIKYFGRETHTIFIPRLETYWQGETFNGTGSYTEVSADDYVLYIKNIKENYKETEMTKLRLAARPRFPVKTYATSSAYKTEYRLPTSSYFSVIDVSSGDTIIPYSTFGTKVGCDSSGNYIHINMNSFLPERFYKLIFKVKKSVWEEKYIDDGYYFKVTR